MNMRWAWLLPVLAIFPWMATSNVARAQGYPGGPAAMPAGYYDPMAGQGQYSVMQPPGMMPGPTPAMGGPGMQGPGGAPGGYIAPEPPPGYTSGFESMGGCEACGGQGCQHCGGGLHRGLLGDVLGIIGPYPDGGCAAVRWFDVNVDFMMLKRDDTGRRQDIASAGINGNIVLSTDDLDFDAEPSFRLNAALQAGPGSNWEFTYYGLFSYDSEVTVEDPGSDLFSVFSDFGTLPFGGFDETDESNFQRITYISNFDNFEVNFRQRWMAPTARYQGSWLAGVRYFKLEEKFRLNTRSEENNGVPAPLSQMFYGVDTDNSLTGAQIGGDMWICLLPGLRIGGEVKAGVFGNHMNVNTRIDATSAPASFLENQQQNDVSFVGNFDAYLTYRINYQWTAKFGYQFMYVDGVALGTENFNDRPPALFNPPPGVTRTPFVNDNGSLFYHGFSVGMEFMW